MGEEEGREDGGSEEGRKKEKEGEGHRMGTVLLSC